MQTNDEEQKENEKNKTCIVKVSSEDEKLKKRVVVIRWLFTRFNAKIDIIDYIKYHH